jgi:AAHS family 3-hydroxyphenylpropionic acid transporter
VQTVPAAGRSGRVLWLCFLAAIIEGFDLQAAGVAAPTLGPALGLTPGQLGLFFGSATFGLIFGALIGGRVADRFGRKAGLVLSLLLFGFFSIGTAFAGSFEVLFAARFLTGVGLGGALPNLVAIAAETAPPERRGTAVAIMYMGMPAGGTAASIISILGLHGSWKTIFIVGGAAPLLLVPVLVLLLPDFRLAAEERVARRTGTLATLFGAGTAGLTLLLWAGFFLSLVVLYVLLNWLPALLVSRGVTRIEAGLAQIGLNLGGAAASLLAGRAMDRMDHRLVVTLSFLALLVALALLGAASTAGATQIAAATFVGAAIMSVQAILYGLAPTLYPAANRGTGVGAAVAAGRTGSVAGPLLAGALLTAGSTAFDVLAGLLPIAALGGVASLALTWLLRRRSGPEMGARGVRMEGASNVVKARAAEGGGIK